MSERHWSRRLLVASMAIALAGSNFAYAEGLALPVPWKSERKEYGVPDSIVAVWTYAVAHTPGQPPTRGFGGRIMFFQDGRERPLKVDGTLTVYAFEEANTSEDKIIPDRRYVFSPEDLARCYSQSKLGHSYSIWIPWDEAGGPQRTVSLIVCFTARSGKTIVSQQSKMMLPGPRQDSDSRQLASRLSSGPTQPQVWTVPAPVRMTAGKPMASAATESAPRTTAPTTPLQSLPGEGPPAGPNVSQSGPSLGPPQALPLSGGQPPISTALPAVYGQPVGAAGQSSSPQPVEPTGLTLPGSVPGPPNSLVPAPASAAQPPGWRPDTSTRPQPVRRFVWGRPQPAGWSPAGESFRNPPNAAQPSPGVTSPRPSAEPIPLPGR